MKKHSAIMAVLVAFIMTCLLGLPIMAGSDDFVEVDQMPTFITQVKPVYPEEVKKAGIEGSVLVKSFINTSGSVTEVEIIETSGNDLLDKAAVEAAQKCKFKPAIKDGRPVAIWVAYKINFKLEEKKG